MEATKVWETEGERERTDQKEVNGSNKSVGNRKNGSEGSKWMQQKCGKQREREKETDQKVVNGSNKSVGNRGRERKNGSEGSKWKQQKCGKQREREKERIRR